MVCAIPVLQVGTDVRLVQHANVLGLVAHGGRDLSRSLPDEACDETLLPRAGLVDNDRPAARAKPEERTTHRAQVVVTDAAKKNTSPPGVNR